MKLDIISLFAAHTKDAHLFERTLAEAKDFKNPKGGFKSPLLEAAFNEARYARMFGGDVLRMLVQGADARSNVRFIPANHGAVYDDELHKLIIKGDELRLIQDLKTEIRTLLYALFDIEEEYRFGLNSNPIYLSETLFYINQFKVSLKKADQNLGLRLGEIYAEKSK